MTAPSTLEARLDRWQLRRYQGPESAKVTTEGCLSVLSLLTALTADPNLSFSEQTNTDTGAPPDFLVPEWITKTPPPKTRLLFSTWVPSSQEKFVALPFDHHDENIFAASGSGERRQTNSDGIIHSEHKLVDVGSKDFLTTQPQNSILYNDVQPR